MRRTLLASTLVLAAASPVSLRAQTARDSVLAAVQGFFDAMAKSDSAAAAAVMRADGNSHSVRYSPDSTTIRVRTSASSLATWSQGKGLLERMWNPTVLIHKDLATVWTAYDFYRDGKFSHCGVDAFVLVREKGRWRISSTAYTVEPTGCAPSPLGPPKP